MDGFAEANLLLTSAMQELEELEASMRENSNSSSSTSNLPIRSSYSSAFTHHNNNNIGFKPKSMPDIDEGLDLDNGNHRDADDERSGKGDRWRTQDWTNRRGSDGSSGVESPPSDIPTSSSSLCNPPKIYQDFVKAIEENTIVERPDLETSLKIMKWMTGDSSPSPSMSTVSCPEYPEIQDKLHRLAMARDSLSLQVSVLTEQVSAQKEKIRDLEAILALKRKNLTSTEELLQEKYRADDCSELESKKMDLMAEMSNLKLKYATLEKEKKETEKKLKISQNEMEYVNQSMHGMVVQQQLQNQSNGYANVGFRPVRSESKQRNENITILSNPIVEEEMDQLRSALHRLMADNEAKNKQITNLRNALDEHIRGRPYPREEYFSPSHRWNEQQFDLNTQIKRLLMEEPDVQMPHSTSFPVSLCSSAIAPHARSTVQSSSSYTSSLSAASPQHWSDTPRHYNPSVKSDCPGYRPPSSPAARQLAAELDELRRVSDIHHTQQRNYSTASLPRGMGNKAASTLTLSAKKLSLSSGMSAGEFRSSASVASAGTRHKYRDQMNRWIAGKLKRNKRATSAPNLVESDDEITRGRNSTTASQASSINQKPLRRDRTRSSLRNLFSKLTRSTSQDHGSQTFKRGSTVRSTSMARLGSTGPLSGGIAIRPPFSQFVDWRSEQLCEWIAEIGFPQYVPDVAKHARSGRHLINMNGHELESILGIRNPLHKKRLKILLKNIEDDNFEPYTKWDVHMSLKWLEEIGLPQYKDVFTENIIDGALLNGLTAADMIEMHITNSHHYYTLSRSLQFLRQNDFNIGCLEKRFDPNLTNQYPCSEQVLKWSHAATCEWLRTIELAEFTPNLLCAGTPGALMVYEPTFTAESLADILKIPSDKSLIRRHLTTSFNHILGQKIIADKRDFLANGVFPQLSPNNRIKVVKKGFSLTRKKAKNEICLEPEELLAPKEIPHQNRDNASSDFSNQ